MSALDAGAVLAAARRLAGRVHRTPVATCATLDRLAGRALFFKGEHLQRSGAFKFRGASNALALLSDEVAARGVVTHSSGNHAGALALAARLRGVPAHVVMPTSASPVKRRATREYGATVVDCAPTLEAREATAAAVLAETGGTLIPPYDHPDVIAGQGTIALELAEQVPDLDAVVAPLGGGGLVGGLCLAATVPVIAAEPAVVDDAARSRAAGQRLPPTGAPSIADGLLTGLGAHNWPLVRDRVAEVITVSEDEIRAAMRLLWERAKLLVEPSAATAFAAVLSPRFPPAPRRVAVVLSGGNVDLDHLPF
jgi:threonine dehydratase